MIYIKNWKQEFAQLLKVPNITIENGLIKTITHTNENNKIHRNSLIGPGIMKMVI